MPRNQHRYNDLTDAGLRVLAREGARGLTHRAVDTESDVPPGTTSNYFRTREELLDALGKRIFTLLAPTPEVIESRADREPSIALYVEYVQDIVARVRAQPSLSLALMELRLESTRYPDLARTLGEILRSNFAADVAFSEQRGMPGGQREVMLLHFAIDGLVLDLLTASIGLAEDEVDAVVADLVTTIVGGSS